MKNHLIDEILHCCKQALQSNHIYLPSKHFYATASRLVCLFVRQITFKLRQGASIPRFVGRSVRLSQKCKCPIFQHIIANEYLFHLGNDEKEEEE